MLRDRITIKLNPRCRYVMFEQDNFSKPRKHLPEPLMMSEANPFAYFTLTKRMPAIVQRVISENDFCSEIVHKLEILIQELPDKTVSLITDAGIDVADWDGYLDPFIGKRWIDMPWFFAETYFYRRILEATHYFLPGKSFGVDPYAIQKCRGLETAINSIRELSARVNDQNNSSLIALIYFALWGNRADMSLFPINPEDHNYQEIHLEQTHILVDDTPQLAEKISKFNHVRIDFIIDNAGFELVGDLCLADFLLTSQAAGIIYLHLKPYPTFVSDATIQDVHNTLAVLAADDDKQVQALVQRLQDYIIQGRLICCDDYFWTSPLMFWEMPEALRNELTQSSLIFIKGDANYRRCLGDLQWSFTTDFEDVVCYFPAPIVVLRTLKSEIAVGLQLEQVEKLNQEDSNWLTNGQWGLIQFAEIPNS
jgi:uncharacterized protein with ATP-grasp and redox domains